MLFLCCRQASLWDALCTRLAAAWHFKIAKQIYTAESEQALAVLCILGALILAMDPLSGMVFEKDFCFTTTALNAKRTTGQEVNASFVNLPGVCCLWLKKTATFTLVEELLSKRA